MSVVRCGMRALEPQRDGFQLVPHMRRNVLNLEGISTALRRKKGFLFRSAGGFDLSCGLFEQGQHGVANVVVGHASG